MSIGRRVRVMMLGWEYPPRFAGGLGKACQGLSQAMARAGAQVFFVLPTFPERVTEPRLEVVGARECLIEAGWDPSGRPGGQNHEADTGTTAAEEPGITRIRSSARLAPYSVASGAVPERLLRRLTLTPTEAEASPSSNIQPRQQPSGETLEDFNNSPDEIYGKRLWDEIERFCFTVRKLAGTHEVDVIHAHDWMTFPAAFEFHRVTGVPVFLHVHATEYDRSGEGLNEGVFRIEREGFHRATHIFAVSRYTAGIIERLYGVHRRKISVIHNAPETESTTAPPVRSSLRRKPQVVFLGRLTYQKGPDHFLKAASIVAGAHAEARFILCGTGDMHDPLRALADHLGIQQHVNFAGFVAPSGVDKILRESSVLVMPSVSEPFGLVALEAIRCGIPVIISKQSGVREVLQRALQIDFWDHEKLADQILAALRLPDLAHQLVRDGWNELKELSWDRSARRVLEAYQGRIGRTYFQAIEGSHGH